MLRFFAGLEFEEIAKTLGISLQTAKSDWSWLVPGCGSNSRNRFWRGVFRQNLILEAHLRLSEVRILQA
jgi:hypothetical protein